MNKRWLMGVTLVVSLGIGALLVPSTSVSALSAEQSAAISQNCSSLKSTLKTLQKTDSRTRVFLGTSYEHILTNFISPLNVRLTKNNRPDTSLADLQTQFASKKRQFADNFTNYMKAMEDLSATDCTADTEIFYKKLEDTRSKRTTVNQLALDMRDLTIKSVEAVNKLKDSL